jgi:hypothetical protein
MVAVRNAPASNGGGRSIRGNAMDESDQLKKRLCIFQQQLKKLLLLQTG